MTAVAGPDGCSGRATRSWRPFWRISAAAVAPEDPPQADDHEGDEAQADEAPQGRRLDRGADIDGGRGRPAGDREGDVVVAREGVTGGCDGRGDRLGRP